MTLHLYLVSVISENVKYLHYDTYDSFVCCCKNEYEARRMHPSLNPLTTTFSEYKLCWIQENGIEIGKNDANHLLGGWIYGQDIHIALKVVLLGNAKEGSEKDIVLASYNAG
jgi:hypothetical protein